MSTHTSPPQPLRRPNNNDTAWLLRRIWTRINERNEHFMGVIVGQEGIGKSHTAIRIANEVDPTFNADRVIFAIEDLLAELRDGTHEPGNFYVLDEAGVQMGRRTWQDRAQVLANQALQLIRNHNLGLIFTLPRLGELDSQAQGRLQAFYEITQKEDGSHVRGKWKWLDPDRADDTGKIYKKYPRRRENGVVKRITSFAFKPPSSDVIDPYEERKEEFQDQIYDETIQQLKDDGEADTDDEKSVREVATEVANGDLEEVVSRHNQNNQPYINSDLIRATYGLSHADSRTVKTLLEKQFSKSDLEELA